MLLDFVLPAHDRKLIPEGRLSGPMPWVIAIMLFLTLLAAATEILLVDAAERGGEDLARQVTVQIIESDPAELIIQTSAVARSLRTMPDIGAVNIVSESEVRRLLEPWLGSAVQDADIPVPGLIDISFNRPPSGTEIVALEKKLRPISPQVKIESHASWMAPLAELVRVLLWLAAGILILLLLATGATVVLAVRSALNTHRETIEILHMMGGTDLQAARLFQRRVALDALLGGLVGFAGAALVIWILGDRFAMVEPGSLSGVMFPVHGWVILALIPLAVTGLAMLMARWTVLLALKKML